MPRVDSILLVATEGKTKRADLAAAIELVQQFGLAGVVLTARPSPSRSTTEHAPAAPRSTEIATEYSDTLTASMGAWSTPVGLGLLALLLLGVAREPPAQP